MATVTWPLPVDFVSGPAFTHRQLATVIVANDPTFPQFRFKTGNNVKVVYTQAESDALGASWSNSPQDE